MGFLRDAVYGLLQDTIQHKIVSKLLDNWADVALWDSPYAPILGEKGYHALMALYSNGVGHKVFVP